MKRTIQHGLFLGITCVLAACFTLADEEPLPAPPPQADILPPTDVNLAEEGDVNAQLHLGISYATGTGGVTQDIAEAAKWFRKAAEQDHPRAQVFLAKLLEEQKEDAEAAKWFRKAAELDDSEGQYYFATMAATGRGASKDMDQAVKCFRKAAEQGLGEAQYELAKLYRDGSGVKQDNVEAYKWFNLAALRGIIEAAVERNKVGEKMTAEQIAEAHRLSTAFVPKITEPPKKEEKD